MTDNTLNLIDEYLTQGGYSPGIDPETLEREAVLVAAAPDLLAALADAQAMLCQLEAPAHLPEAAELDERIAALIVRIEGE